jgi:hypothetical protein
MSRFIIQPDKTSSSEYEVWDVIGRKSVASGLDLQSATDSKNSREEEWQKERDKIGT